MSIAYVSDGLQQKYDDLSQRFEQIVNEHDVWCRAKRNNNMSYAYRFMYISLVETYPCLLDGMPTQINVWKVRENAGWTSKESATKFFQDMSSIGIFTYEPGEYSKDENARLGYLTPNPDRFPYPESFDTRNTEKRAKARKDAQDKRDLALEALKRFNCENCGSMTLGYIAKCEVCQHIHTQDIPIPVSRIAVQPDGNNGDIDWDKEIEEYEGAA